jgi:LysM repeat protein
MAIFAGLLALAVCLGGCIPGDSHVDEEKDPHYERGINLVNSQYDNKVNDSAAAIYHYERHLQLMPNSDRAQSVKERIRLCKQELANTEFPLPNSQNLQRAVDRLTAENVALKEELAALLHPAAAREELARRGPQTVRVAAGTPSAAESVAPLHRRVHVVKARETIRSIASEYGLKASAILAANPRVDPLRLRIGQSLNLP